MTLRIDRMEEEKALGITRFTVWRADTGIVQVSLLSHVVKHGNYEPLLHHALDRKREAQEAVTWEDPESANAGAAT